MNFSNILKISTGVLAGATVISAAADMFFNQPKEVEEVEEFILDEDFVEI